MAFVGSVKDENKISTIESWNFVLWQVFEKRHTLYDRKLKGIERVTIYTHAVTMMTRSLCFVLLPPKL
jgi:hypothetical protein